MRRNKDDQLEWQNQYRMAYNRLNYKEKVKIVKSIMKYYDDNDISYDMPDIENGFFFNRFIYKNMWDTTLIEAVTGL